MCPDPYQSDDDDGTNSDTSDGLVEVSTHEIPGYFQERGGQLFHSHARSPYPLPVDQEEHQVSCAERLAGHMDLRSVISTQGPPFSPSVMGLRIHNGINKLLRRLIGDSSVGPVRDILVDVPGEERRVLDLGPGTGEWCVIQQGCHELVLDMAREFPRPALSDSPSVPVPIATRYSPRNVLFEMHDIAEKFRYDSGSIDFVHARSISMAIRDYGAVLPEIARVLRPDGLFVSNDDLALHAPSTSEFFRAVREMLHERCGIPTTAHKIPELLQDSGFFTGIVSRRYYMPIGSWNDDPGLRELGREYRGMVELYARAMRAVLNEGRWAARADALIHGYIDESWRVPGLVSVYYTVHARREFLSLRY
ncbi:S-adenosyl-L-methionine-dependent methyltransferase [Ganoderma leucocontextum]|nr:S-adenosyl-L-methionine-dependent methyltransferase [Ganoderma leucocontextum]